MTEIFYRLYAETVLEVLAWLRRVASVNGRLYTLLHAPILAAFPCADGHDARARLIPEGKPKLPGVQHVS